MSSRGRTAWSAALAPLLALAAFALAVGCTDEKHKSAGTQQQAEETPEAVSNEATGEPTADQADAEDEQRDAEGDVEAAMDPKAVEVLKRMVQSLADAQALGVRVDEEYDAYQSDGTTLSFGKTSTLTMRRPDRLRIETTVRNGARRVSTFDGKKLTVYDSVANRFAQVEHSSDIDSLLDFLRDDVGMKLPLAPLFSTQLRELLLDNVDSADFIDEEQIEGVDVDHIAFNYGEGIGVQLWIPHQGQALPRRMVMTFEDARGRPQFRADFREWKLTPDVSEKVFAFTAPEGARSLPFILPKRTAVPQPGEGS